MWKSQRSQTEYLGLHDRKTRGAECSLTKSYQAITYIVKSFVKVDVEKIQVDPQL